MSELKTESFVPVAPQSVGPVIDEEGLSKLLEKVHAASLEFRTIDSQEAVDRIFAAAALAANNARLSLARMAVAEGRIGNIEDKALKNHVASDAIYNTYKDMKTCGVVERDESGGFEVFAEPIGVLAGIVPCTNPTSTTIFKALLALKSRNCIVFSPHPRTAKCTIAAARIVRDAAVSAGAPADCIGWIDKASVALCSELMRHNRVAMILATGAGALVKAAYSSGKPAMGGGAGNTPVVIDETADVASAVSSVLLSKTFDNGVICASEQAVIVVDPMADKVKEEFLKRGAYFLDKEEKERVGNLIIMANGALNPAAVGQSAWELAEMANVTNAPEGVRLLLVELDVVGPEEKLSHEKLCPCLGFYRASSFDSALDRALELLHYGGMGHTSVLHTDPDGQEKSSRVSRFKERMPTGRTLVNMPTSHGGIGGIFNFRQLTSLSLGCGSWGNNASAEGLQVKHLLNYKQVAERRERSLWFRVPPTIYFNRGAIKEILGDLMHARIRRVFIVTNHHLKSIGHVDRVCQLLRQKEIITEIFWGVNEDPNVPCITEGVRCMTHFNPDALLALGGGSVIDAAKAMRIMYEQPEVDLTQLYIRFLDINHKVLRFPKLGTKIMKFICVPTTSGAGAEMTPYALITDAAPCLDITGSIVAKQIKRPIADYSLTPDIVVVDSEFVMSLPKDLVARSGFEAICHSLESSVSMLATDYTRGLAVQSLGLLLNNLRKSMDGVAKAREACHNAASIAGMAFANSFMGIRNALANQLTSFLGIPHGVASAMLICQVIKFNAEDAPAKQGTFPQYSFPCAKEDYARLADSLGLTKDAKTLEEKVDILIETLQTLKRDLGLPASLKAYGVDRKVFCERVEEMALLAFDDQCTSSNPRYPLISELQQIMEDAYDGFVHSMPRLSNQSKRAASVSRMKNDSAPTS